MKRTGYFMMILVLFGLTLTACSAAPSTNITYDPDEIKFSGEKAYIIEEEFVTKFPNRDSGQPNSILATEWLSERFTELGLECQFDSWDVINYSQPITYKNVVCKLQGESNKEILIMAHHDQAPTTIQGADNDGSGISILLHLADIFTAEKPLKYTLVFLATDAEEYGMVGSRRYVQTHPNTEDIIAGISLDNLGLEFYDGMNMELIGQFSGYGPIWLALTARDSAKAANTLWEVNLRLPIDQALDQAVPLSFMDQGPVVQAGVPAIGFAASTPPEMTDEKFRLWHHPDDTIDRQSPASLGQTGAITEALIRQLLSMDSFPKEIGPYLYFDNSAQVLRGVPLYLIFVGVVCLYFVGGIRLGEGNFQQRLQQMKRALPHYLGIWLPLVATILMLYLFVAVGIMDEYHLYPATTKDPALLNPRWSAILLFLFGLGFFLWVGRRLVSKFSKDPGVVDFKYIRSLAFLIIGFVCIYILLANPFSLLLCVPTYFWFLIKGRKRYSKILDIIFFLLGALFIYAIVYFFGFQILRLGFGFLWMFLNMFSIKMISFQAAVASVAILAAGLSLVINQPSSIANEIDRKSIEE